MKIKKPELLLPAGDYLKMKTAFLYGADAIYAGSSAFSLRSQAKFEADELSEGIKFAHSLGKKVYLNLNVVSRNDDIEKLAVAIPKLATLNPDGFIISDNGVFDLAMDLAPNVPKHISTQANIASYLTVKSWQKRGASLCILARELSINEIKTIREKCPDVRLEAFVHGAMCMSHSGRCLISSYLTNRSANKGICSHSCRWNYKLHLKLKDGSIEEIPINDKNRDLFNFLVEEEFRPGEFLEVEENENGSFLFNAKDLCLLPVLDEVLSANLDSLKIEGRNKSAYYVAVTAKAYRLAIDSYFNNPEDFSPIPFMKELYTVQTRGYSLGFHRGIPTHLAHDYNVTSPLGEWLFAGMIKENSDSQIVFEVKNTLRPNDVIEFVMPNGMGNHQVVLDKLIDAVNDKECEMVSPNKNSLIKIDKNLFKTIDASKVPEGTVARIQTKLPDEKLNKHLEKIEFFEMETGVSTKELKKRLS
ncbi:MAG: U32 family peptidase [Alphaproteobacteria bacterium]